MRTAWLFFCTLFLVGVPLRAAEPDKAEALLQLDAQGPTARVTALAFSKDGNTLHAAGYDKVVRSWQFDGMQFVRRERLSYRIPLGPGAQGNINALAVSSDDAWLAVGGVGLVRESAGFREPGIVLPATGRIDDEMRRDLGAIFVFNRAAPEKVRALRGHKGPVLALSFVRGGEAQAKLLASYALEFDGTKEVGVVRLWDVEKGAEVAGVKARVLPAPPRGVLRPGLAAVAQGQGDRAVAVAIAARDGVLRVWEVSRDELTEGLTDGPGNDTVAVLSSDRLLTGSFRAQSGVLTGWKLVPGAKPVVDNGLNIRVGKNLWPRALGVAGAERIATVVRQPDADERKEAYRLHLFDAAGKAQADVPLWTGGQIQPTLACVPKGRFIAAAGNLTHEIHIYDINDLVKQKEKPFHQTVRSAGQWWQYVAFVKKGKSVGLALSSKLESRTEAGTLPRKPAEGDLIFDFGTNRLTNEIAGWELDCATPAEGITLPKLIGEQRRTTFASLPKGAFNVPLLAQAFQERGQTYLFLTNPETSQDVRLCTGHLNAVTSLAFSRDGRLLASVAEDQTICVWSLSDLDRTLGQHGLIRGLVVRSEEKKLVVSDLDQATLSAVNRQAFETAGIKVNTPLDALIEKDKPRALKDMRDFYQAVWQSVPGSKITLRFGDKDVTLTVDQGVDERKPLFTLFLTRSGEWIGWNPQGPYDRSGEETEQLIGWHQNTGQAQTPVTFASADKYRKEYLRSGLLDKLMVHGDLGAALTDLNKQVVPDPVVRVELRENGKLPVRRDGRGLPVVQQRPLELVVHIDNVAENQLTGVRWRLDDGEWSDFTRQTGTEYRHDLSTAAWKRGTRTLEVAVRTRDAARQARSLQVSYLPPAPELSFPADWLKQFGDTRQTAVRTREFPIASTVEAVKGETARLTLLLNGAKVKDFDTGKLGETLTLKEGRNELVVRAVNTGAVKGQEADETVERVFTVDYSPVPVPRLVVESITPAGPGTTFPRENVAVVLHQRQVRIRGSVEAETELTEVSLDGKLVPDFKAGTVKKWTIDIQHKLDPGEQTLVLKAQAKDSPERTWKLKLDYLPELPEFVLRKGDDLEALPGDTRQITLEGLVTPLEEHPYEFNVVVGERMREVKVERATQTFKVTVPVEPGANTFTLVAKLKERTRELRVRAYVRRPPTVVRFEAPAALDKPLVTLKAEIETAAEVEVSSIRLTGTGAERQIDLAKEVSKGEAQNGKRRWLLELADVPLVEEKENELVLRVANRDGEVQQRVTVKGPKRKIAAAAVLLLDPKRDVTVQEEKYALKFAVNSTTPLTRLAVLRDGEEVAVLPHRDRITEQTVNIALKSGPNVLEVVAVNEGGEARSEKRTISRRADTVFLHIDKMVLRADAGQETKPVRKEDRLVFEEVRGGELVLHGRVRWLERRAEVYQPQLVRVWVNDFEQFPASLDKADDTLERGFRLSLRLNQEKNNRVVLALPGLKVDQTTPLDFAVEKCLKPEKEQRIHLLIVGVGLQDNDQGKLVNNVLEVFQARNVKPGNARNLVTKEFQTPVFKEGRVYGPMAGDATKQEVYAMLEHISETVRGEQGQMNEVLVVYFQGQRAVTRSDYFLLTQQARLLKNYERAALTRDGLRGAIGKTLGAQLLLLDVTQIDRTEVKPEAPTDFQRIGMFEYTWLRDNPPENGRLLETLKESMTQARLLTEVKDQVTLRGARLKEKDKAFLYDIRVSEILGQMAVGSGN